MTPERPPSRSQALLRSTLHRNPPSPARAHKRRHSHVPPSLPADTTDHHTDTSNQQLDRAAFLYRTAATAPSPLLNTSSPSPSRPASPFTRPASPSPSCRQPLPHSPASDLGLHRHNSTPSRKRPPSTPEPSLSPHEQVLRARLERVLNNTRVADSRDRSRERRRTPHTEQEATGWPWFGSQNDRNELSPSSSSRNKTSDYPQNPRQHYRTRSKTDPILSTSPASPPSSRRATVNSNARHPPLPVQPVRHDSNSNISSTGTTPPLTADASPVLSDSDLYAAQNLHDSEPDDLPLFTPPPSPPLAPSQHSASQFQTPPPLSRRYSSRTGVPMYRSRTSGSSDYAPSPFLYPLSSGQSERRETSIERFDLHGVGIGHPSSAALTFNARKASERCRMMEGYVSFASIEGLGMPPEGVDDEDGDERKSNSNEDKKRGRSMVGIQDTIGGWAKRLFVGMGSRNDPSGPVPHTSPVVL